MNTELTSPRMVASVEQGGGAARPDTSDLPAAAAVAEPDPTEHVASVSVGVVAADREAFDSDGVEHRCPHYEYRSDCDCRHCSGKCLCYDVTAPDADAQRLARLSRWQEQRG